MSLRTGANLAKAILLAWIQEVGCSFVSAARHKLYIFYAQGGAVGSGEGTDQHASHFGP